MNLVPIFEATRDGVANAPSWLVDVTVPDFANDLLLAEDLANYKLRSSSKSIQPGAFYITSQDMAEAMQARHYNVLRQIRGFARKLGRDITGQSDSGWDSFDPLRAVPGMKLFRKGRTVTSAVLALPTFHAFVQWLLKSLVHHTGTHQRRIRQLLSVFGPLSGLSPLRLMNPLTVRALWVAWPVEVDEDALVDVGLSGHDKRLDFVLSALASDRIALAHVAGVLGYSVKQVHRKLLAARAEFSGSIADGFLTEHDGYVDHKTAMFLVQAMPRAVSVRLSVFNALYARMSPTPRMLTVDDPAQTVDCRDVDAVQAVITRMQQQLSSEREQRTRELADAQQKLLQAETDRRAAQAAHTGALSEALSLKAALHNVTASGAVSNDPADDEFIHSSAKLRSDHALMTVQDVAASLMKSDLDLPRMFEGCKGSMLSNIASVLRFFIGYKYLSADGAPVLRPETIQGDVARRYRVYVSDNSSAGHREKHGSEQRWRWSVFYTPNGQRTILEQFHNLVEAWWQADRPSHMQKRSGEGNIEE